MARTVKNVLKSALKKAKVLPDGATPSSEEYNDALEIFNDLITTWSVNNLGIFIAASYQHVLTVSDSTITIGPSSADIDTVRPERIHQVFIRDENGVDTPVENELDRSRYLNISSKQSPGTPNSYYYEATAPNGTLHLYPVPNSSGTIHISGSGPLSNVSLTTDIESILPEPYIVALKYNAAVIIAEDWGGQIGQVTLSMAVKTREDLETIHASRSVKPVNVNSMLGRDSGASIMDC